MIHEVEVSNLLFNKTTDGQIDFKKYDINVDLEEKSSDDQTTVLKFSLDLTSNPKNSVINISGNTKLSGEQSEIEEFLKQEHEKTPEVVSLIYQELFPLMYIISKNMKIPSPAHTISQNNIREFENSNEQLKTVSTNQVEPQLQEKDKETKEDQKSKTESLETENKTDVETEGSQEQNKEETS